MANVNIKKETKNAPVDRDPSQRADGHFSACAWRDCASDPHLARGGLNRSARWFPI